MQMPGISVLLPVYLPRLERPNVESLDRALSSIFDQGYEGPLEILVLDDGSPEPVRDLAPHLRHGGRPEIRWLRSPRNGGLVDALNRGLRAARHPLIARIDADDAWREGKLAAQLELLRADPEITIVGTGMTLVDVQGREIEHHVRRGDWAGILEFVLTVGCPFPHGSILARTEIFRLLGGYSHDPTVRHCEDFDLWARWLRFFKPAMVERSLYAYTVSGNQISARHREQQLAASGSIQRRFIELGVAATLPEDLRALARATGLTLLGAGRLAHAMWHFGAAAMLPEAALDPLRRLLPDRDIRRLPGGAPAHPIDRLAPGEVRAAPAGELLPWRAVSVA